MRAVRAGSLVVLVLAAPACVQRAERGAPVGRDTARPASRPEAASPAARRDSSPPARDDAWFTEADSALRVALAGSLYLAPKGVVSGVRECAGDEGSDDPPSLVAAARTRIVGHDSLSSGSAGEYGDAEARMRTTTFRVEVVSAARMTPARMLELRPDSTAPDDAAYAIVASPRLDTFDIALADVGASQPRWAICAPVRGGSEAGARFWAFTHADDDWVKPVRWTPATASWARVRALADSLAAVKE